MALKPRKTSKGSASSLYSTCNPSNHDSSSSSDEVRVSSYTTDNEILKNNKKKINCSKTSIQVEIESLRIIIINNKSVEEKVEKKKNESSLCLPRKSLFGKQKPLWKRIFFASKKVRSVILLNLIVVPLLDGMLGAIVPAVTWIGALISIVGVTLLESSGSPPSVGDLLNFLSAVFLGVHMLRTEHFARSTKSDNFLPLLGYEVCVVAIFSIIWYFVGGWFGDTHELDPGSWTWPVVRYWLVNFPWIPAIYTGVLLTGVCLWGEMSAMRDVSATETAIIYGLEPLWGAGFAWFLLGERWGITGWIGAALVLGGSLTVQIFGSESPKKARENEDDIDKLLLSDKGKSFSPSPVVVTTTTRKKNVSDFLKK
ncbi:hypothetical protein MKX01_008851 [Papaver californicum]|nr:hypothetical protein MKX01_008851 [Papaver californicum]